MAGFKDFKKSQGKIQEAVKNLKDTKGGFQDDRIWNITKDAAGNGSATVRLLPQQDPSKPPIVQTFRHGFQEKGRWFIEECPHTIGEPCPVCEYSSEMFETDEDLGRKYWRTKTYIANVLVVKDDANPENNGKVKIFKFGKQIYDQIMNAVAPEDDDDQPVEAFAFDGGHNFRLKLYQKGGYNCYDRSKFEMNQTDVADGDETEQEKIFNALFSLDQFTDRKLYKDYSSLQKKFAQTIGASVGGSVEEDMARQDPAHKPVPESAGEEDDGDVGSDDDIDFDSLLGDD